MMGQMSIYIFADFTYWILSGSISGHFMSKAIDLMVLLEYSCIAY